MAKDINEEINKSNPVERTPLEDYYQRRFELHLKYLKDVKAAEDAAQRDKEKVLRDSQKASLREQAAYWKEYSKNASTAVEKLKGGLKSTMLEAAESFKNAMAKSISSTITGVQSYINLYDNYMSRIEARIQGSDRSFETLTSTIKNAVGSSQYISQAKVLEKLSSLVEQGIVYNVEQRAFLSTISEKIATTFDAANGTLLQLIRIQQADTTAARLGIEASLTRFLNRTFSDTSYLNNDYDIVMAALMGASSQMSARESVAFEYAAQKWLGSLGSVGVSSSTLQSIAQGLNYLGTGDIGSLSSNDTLQRLFVAAAQRGGVDYASVLTGGITAQDVNSLMKGIVSLGSELASTNNQVVKSQYAQLFGLTISDMTALLNLSSKDLVEISKNMLTYEETMQEVADQLASVPERMHLSERINNLVSNVMYSMGTNIANNAGLYTTWTVAGLVEQAVGGINIPSVMGVDLNTTVSGLLKTAIVGANFIGEIGNIISGLSGANNLALSNWGAADTLTRGEGATGIKSGTRKSNSFSGYVGDTSADIAGTAIAKAEQEAVEKKGGTETDLTLELLKEIYRILDRVSNYGGNAIKVDTEANGYALGEGRGSYLFGL